MPLCEFEAEGNHSSLLTVYVNVDNTRSFVFGRDPKRAQTNVQCHGATPEACTKPHLLSTGAPQSCESYECSCVQATLSLETIHMNYVKKMVQKVGPFCRDYGAEILHIGLGGAALSTYLLENCGEGTHVTSVEKDPRVIKMAKKFFGLRLEPGRNDVENADASTAVQRHVDAGDHYNVVLIDCFESHGRVPESCTSKAFVRGVRHLLKSNGLAIQQVRMPQYSDLHHDYISMFGQEHLRAEQVDDSGDYIIIAHQSNY